MRAACAVEGNLLLFPDEDEERWCPNAQRWMTEEEFCHLQSQIVNAKAFANDLDGLDKMVAFGRKNGLNVVITDGPRPTRYNSATLGPRGAPTR